VAQIVERKKTQQGMEEEKRRRKKTACFNKKITFALAGGR